VLSFLCKKIGKLVRKQLCRREKLDVQISILMHQMSMKISRNYQSCHPNTTPFCTSAEVLCSCFTFLPLSTTIFYGTDGYCTRYVHCIQCLT